jgi:hypothetical protein
MFRHVLSLLTLFGLVLGLALGHVADAAAKARHKHQAVIAPYGVQTQNVYASGTLIGADPDPNIRAALIREFGRRR